MIWRKHKKVKPSIPVDSVYFMGAILRTSSEDQELDLRATYPQVVVRCAYRSWAEPVTKKKPDET